MLHVRAACSQRKERWLHVTEGGGGGGGATTGDQVYLSPAGNR